MSWRRVELGRRSFTSGKAKLQLDIDAFANLISTDPWNNLSKLQQLLRSPEDIWISKAHDFHLSFSLSFDPRLHVSQLQEVYLLEHVGLILESAELWRQLSCTASSTFLSSSPTVPESKNAVILDLHTTIGNGDRAPDELERLPDEEFEITSLQPPDGVSSGLLSSVKVSFHLSLEELSEEPPTVCVASYSSYLSSHKKKREKRYEVSIANLLPLVDAAFRNLMCPRPIRTYPGIKLSDERSCRYLADMAPGIFVPGYARSLADRARFIPGISKAIIAFMDRSDSSAVQARRTELLQPSYLVNTEPPSEAESNDGGITIKAAIKGHLWLSLANALRTVEPTRRLKPLQSLIEDVGIGLSGHEDCEQLPEITAFDRSFDTELAVGADSEPMLLYADDDNACGLDDEFLFDLYDASITVPSVTADMLVEKFDNFTVDILDWGHQAQGEALRCYPARSSDSKKALNSALSAADACEKISSTTGLGSQQIYHNGWDYQGPTRSPGQGSSHVAELSHWAVQSDDLMTVIGGDMLLTESSIRQHPSEPHWAGDVRPGTPPSIFEEVDCLQFNQGLLRQLSLIRQDEEGSEVDQSRDPTLAAIENDYLIDLDMSSDTQSTRASLSDVLGGEHLLWNMWKRRGSAAPKDEDIMEMHNMYSGDPDMRLLSHMKTIDEPREDEEMLDGELSSNASPVMSPTNDDNPFSYSRQSTDRSPAPRPTSSASSNGQTMSRPKAKRTPSFLKRLSSGRSASRQTSVDLQIEDLIDSRSRPMEIKRRKTLEDYEMVPGDDEMLLQ